MARHDRTGDEIDDDDPAAQPPHRCDGGWIDRDANPARPCLVCKPHLSRENLRRAIADADTIRATRHQEHP
ncbi:hypothetical protein GCM10027258_62990 [Amycolatopsis stemonae]